MRKAYILQKYTNVIMFVSNTSTLILLAKIGALQLFLENSPKIEIPKEVVEEINARPDAFDAQMINNEIRKRTISIREADKNRTTEALQNFRLDRGEAAAYALFDKKKHAALLTDDGELIKLCRLENIPFICAMAIIIRLYEKKKYSQKETLEKIERLQAIGRYDKDIIHYYKEQVMKNGNNFSSN